MTEAELEQVLTDLRARGCKWTRKQLVEHLTTLPQHSVAAFEAELAIRDQRRGSDVSFFRSFSRTPK